MLRNTQHNLYTLVRNFSLNLSRCAAKKSTSDRKRPDEDIWADASINPAYLSRTIGSSYRRWNDILTKHPQLRSVQRKDIENAAETLKTLEYNFTEIMSRPMILYHNSLTLVNRYRVLREVGFRQISISLLAKYIAVLNKSVMLLKSHGFIPFADDVRTNLTSCFTDVNLDIPSNYEFDENVALKVLRQQVINIYLRQRLEMSNSDIEKLWKVYGRLRHRSFRSVQQMTKVLLEDLQFPKERIIKNAYLLHGDADNVRRILNEIKTIDGQDVRDIVYRRPKILMTTCDSLLKTLEHVKSFGIGEDAVVRCLEVLTLGPDTVLERLQDLNQIEEFQVLNTNPRVLRLVHYQNKARLRLEYLNQLKVRCASLHILSCGSDAFAKFARDGSDRTKGRDIVVYLGSVMHKNENQIRAMLSRHPNWCHIPAIHVKHCYDFLISKKFYANDIYRNIHLLLYPIKRIDEKLQQLQQEDFLEEMHLNVMDMRQLNNSKTLTLVLYLIECEFHFTGDGIWTEQHTQHVENFHNLLPDFPESLNKVYRYGVRPASPTLTETVHAQF